LAEVVRASASIPPVSRRIGLADGDTLRLIDGGLSDPVSLTFAQQPAMGGEAAVSGEVLRVIMGMARGRFSSGHAYS